MLLRDDWRHGVCAALWGATLLWAALPVAAQTTSGSTPVVPCFGKFEAAFTLADQTGNPFDPADNDVDVMFAGPKKTQITVPAFWDGDRWRVRFAPTQEGTYRLTVMRNGRTEHPADLTASRFRCASSLDPGFVRRDPKTTQRFVFDNGQTYYPLGMNVAWTGGSGPDYPVYFAAMGRAHMNWARVWMTFWDGKALEWAADRANNPPRGTFLLDAARRWDGIFDEAAKDGVYIQMTLQHHGQYTEQTDPNWRDNPYNVANGGFLARPDDFFTDPTARRLTRAKYRYIAARWGYSTHLLSYELFNEVQNIGEARGHFGDVVAWHKEMAAYLRSVDVNHHLQTTSNSVPGEPLAQIGLDYDQIHAYPSDIVSTFANADTAAVPLFYGEWGSQDTKTQMTASFLHDGLWASLMAPTAGAGQFWFWDQVEKNGWWPEFASAARFVRMFGADWWGDMTRLHPQVTSSGPRAALSFALPGGWEATTKSDITLPPDGQTPDLAGVSSFVQGRSHRDMTPSPITFHLHCAVPCRFEVQIGATARAGAHPTLALDGNAAQDADFPAADKDQDVTRTLSLDVPTGAHSFALFNTGQDWFTVKQITVTDYAPAVAKGKNDEVLFWVYARDRGESQPLSATVTLPVSTPGPHWVLLWETKTGTPGGSSILYAGASGLVVPLPNLTGDVAGVVTGMGETKDISGGRSRRRRPGQSRSKARPSRAFPRRVPEAG